MVLEAHTEEWLLLGGSGWAVTGNGNHVMFQGVSKCPVSSSECWFHGCVGFAKIHQAVHL